MFRNKREHAPVRKATHSGAWYTDNGKVVFVKYETFQRNYLSC